MKACLKNSFISIIYFIGIWSLALTVPAEAQVYEIPFATANNVIELEVMNEGTVSASNMNVEAVQVPEWIILRERKHQVNELTVGQSHIVSFQFDSREQVEVGKVHTLIFHIIQNGEVIGVKKFQLTSEAPANFELFANYPNPFNPATTISYQLPEQTKVTVQIFNILGQLVSEPVNASQKPGKHQFLWNASQYASGVYLYRFVGKTENGKQFMEQRKMLLVK